MQTQQMEHNRHGKVFAGLPQCILDAIPMGCICWDGNYCPVACNDSVVRLFDMTSKTELLEHVFQLAMSFTGRPNQLNAQHLQNALDRGHCRLNWDFHTPRGETIPTEMTLVRLEHEHCYYILGGIRDISVRNTNLARIREADERLQLLYDVTPLVASFWEVSERDENGHILSVKLSGCNQEAVMVFGVADKEEFVHCFFELSPPAPAFGRPFPRPDY